MTVGNPLNIMLRIFREEYVRVYWDLGLNRNTSLCTGRSRYEGAAICLPLLLIFSAFATLTLTFRTRPSLLGLISVMLATGHWCLCKLTSCTNTVLALALNTELYNSLL